MTWSLPPAWRKTTVEVDDNVLLMELIESTNPAWEDLYHIIV